MRYRTGLAWKCFQGPQTGYIPAYKTLTVSLYYESSLVSDVEK